MKRVVALKVCPAQGAPREVIERFMIEAQTTSQLEHPNIVPIYDSGVTPDEELFYTMKLVRGRSLTALLKERALALPRLLNVLRDVANGMAYAHARGVIHRDLKPDNIMVGEFGEVLVMDWGLARIMGAAADRRRGNTKRATTSAGKTMDGDVMGTPLYMAPEQARGDVAHIDARTDVYALGAILYRIVAGRAPIQAAAARVEPLPRGVPAELAAIVTKAMARERENRYATAAALADDVRAYLEGRAVGAATYTPWALAAKWVRRNKLLAGGIAAALERIGADEEAQIRHERERLERMIEDIQGGLDREGREPGAPLLEDYVFEASSFHDEQTVQILRATLEPFVGRTEWTDPERVLVTWAGRVLPRLRLRVADELAANLTSRGLDLAQARVGYQLEPWEEYAIEAAGYRREQTVTMMADLLRPYVERAMRQVRVEAGRQLEEALWPQMERGRRGRDEANWTDEERRTIRFACRVLGRLNMNLAVAPLAELMEAIWDEDLVVECGIALCDTQRLSAHEPLVRARDRLGMNGNAWGQIRPFFARVPDPEAATPQAAEEFNARGLIREDKQDYAGAIEDYGRAIELDPQSALAHSNRAGVLYELGRLEEALESANRAVDLDPVHSWGLFQRGRIRVALGDRAGAIDDLEEFLRVVEERGKEAEAGALLEELRSANP